MRIYVIGPVTGREDRNRAAFEEARHRLEAAGHDASTPLDFVPEDAEGAMAMRMSLCWMLGTGRIDGVARLDDWERSAGASVESAVALACGLPCGDVAGWEAMGS